MSLVHKPAAVDHPILEAMQQRWSPLAFAPTPLSAETLRTLFEAARWAPSSFNEQPWRFVLGSRRDSPGVYEALLGTLFPSNAAWAKTAPVLFLAVAKDTFTHNDVPNRVALYDVGQAVGHLTVQAATMGLVLHQMGGFDAAKARVDLAIPEGFTPVAMAALGYLGEASVLGDPALEEKHARPGRVRRALDGSVFGVWGEPGL